MRFWKFSAIYISIIYAHWTIRVGRCANVNAYTSITSHAWTESTIDKHVDPRPRYTGVETGDDDRHDDSESSLLQYVGIYISIYMEIAKSRFCPIN